MVSCDRCWKSISKGKEKIIPKRKIWESNSFSGGGRWKQVEVGGTFCPACVRSDKKLALILGIIALLCLLGAIVMMLVYPHN